MSFLSPSISICMSPQGLRTARYTVDNFTQPVPPDASAHPSVGRLTLWKYSFAHYRHFVIQAPLSCLIPHPVCPVSWSTPLPLPTPKAEGRGGEGGGGSRTREAIRSVAAWSRQGKNCVMYT
ncbi:hypothetical protein ACOMHN_037334 [Nucella lapillus]